MTNGEPQPLERFQQLLLEMFRSDRTELDFGIYHIINHKRDAIEKFIEETLPRKVAAALDEEYRQKARSSAALKKVTQEVEDSFGAKAIGPDGEIDQKYLDAPLGIKYKQIREQAAGIGDRKAIETDVYGYLYRFFGRYYQDGDFVSKRHYSARHQYAVPYNGEEVYLHWANSDQYYVKTAEYFRDYDWKAPDGSVVRFELRKADVEHNNVKGDRRFFLPLAGKMQWDGKAKKAVIPFEYRPLTVQEGKKYGRSRQQEKIVSAAVGGISGRLAKMSPDLAASLRSKWDRNGKGSVSHLEHHLRQYTQRNSSDFFIHKDLEGFLTRELDSYLKSEVLGLDAMERAGERNAAGWFQKMRLIRSVGGNIIDFLAQIEDFQKTLWEKRKFVAEAHYCIAVGSIDPKFYPAITGNKAQWAEWRRLLGIGSVGRKADFLKKHPALMVDTRHFGRDFADGLLAGFDDLDAATDGLLVHSENWQALNLLMEKYRQRAMCVYIDPPYNSKTSEILYKNDYKHSSWLSLIDNRIGLSRQLSTVDGSHVVAIDENEQVFLGQLLMNRFSDHKNICVTVIHNKKGIQGGYLSYNHDFAYFCIPPALSKAHGKKIPEEEWKYNNLRKWGGESERSTAKRCFYPIFVSGVEIVGFGDLCDDSFHPGKANVPSPPDGPQGETVAVYPVDGDGVECKWRYARGSVESIKHLLKVQTTKSGEVQIRKAVDESTFKTVWDDPKYIAGDHGTKWLTNLGLKEAGKDLYPKSLYTVMDSIRIAADSDSLVLDYFAGSGTTGHAVVNLNREDGGRRKFVLVEMAEYFDRVLLPRIKQVAYAPEWDAGKPKRVATAEEAELGPQVVKYIRLESYEDALDNIKFDGSSEQLTLEDKFGDYLVKYMLGWETRESETMLNVEKLTKPFSYALRLRADGGTRTKTVDLPETFNYLLGLNVRSRRAYDDKGRRYLVYRGETRDAPGRIVAAIWRETAGWKLGDFKRDKAFVKKHGLAAGADTVFANGDSLILDAKPVEKLFHERMFAGVGA